MVTAMPLWLPAFVVLGAAALMLDGLRPAQPHGD
jgi:hypothetical protein